MKLYADRNGRSLEPHLSRHMLAMTEEELHNKGDIAIELAWRDQQIQLLREAGAELLRADDAWHGSVNSEMATARSKMRFALRATDPAP